MFWEIAFDAARLAEKHPLRCFGSEHVNWRSQKPNKYQPADQEDADEQGREGDPAAEPAGGRRRGELRERRRVRGPVVGERPADEPGIDVEFAGDLEHGVVAEEAATLGFEPQRRADDRIDLLAGNRLGRLPIEPGRGRGEGIGVADLGLEGQRGVVVVGNCGNLDLPQGVEGGGGRLPGSCARSLASQASSWGGMPSRWAVTGKGRSAAIRRRSFSGLSSGNGVVPASIS